MKATLVSSPPIRFAVFVLLSAFIGHAAANTEPAATIESLQHGFAEQQVLLATQAEQLKRQEQRIREQAEQLQTMQQQLRQLVAMQSGGAKGPGEQLEQSFALEPGEAESEQVDVQAEPSRQNVAPDPGRSE